jgi:hypothetical protein
MHGLIDQSVQTLFGVCSSLFTSNTFFFPLLFPPVLSEAQQKLLVKSLEKKILPVQLKLVRKSDRCQRAFRAGWGVRGRARTCGNMQTYCAHRPQSFPLRKVFPSP